MTVKAEITSTLNGQTAEFILIEESPRGSRSHETKTLSGGTEEFVFTELDGGRDKTYYPKVQLETSDVTQTAQVPYGMEVQIDPLPHRDAGASEHVREGANFTQGVGANELGLGDNALVGGLLTTALNDGEVLADDGYVYSSVQAAQDAADSWIFIGPGTFDNSTTFDTPELSIVGSGYNTNIEPSTESNAVVITAGNQTVRNLRVTGQPNATGIIADSANIENVYVTEGGNHNIQATNTIISGCTVEAGFVGINFQDDNIITNTKISNTLDDGARVSSNDNNIISNCIITNAGGYGIINTGSSSNNIYIGNRVHNSNSYGIRVFSGDDNIVANNRVSDSTNVDIDDTGTGTVLDDNLTGPAN